MPLGVEFEEPEFMNKKYNNVGAPKGMSTYLIKNGWAHDQASANKLLVFIIILFILASAIIYYLFVIRAQETQVVFPESVLNKLPAETQMKIRASQR